MIEGVEVRDVTMRTDERGHLAELYSENFGDSIVHVYRCMVRPGVVKAFHCHVGRKQDDGSWLPGQTDRFTPISGVTKVGLVDLRGPLHDSIFSTRLSQWHYLGVDNTEKPFREVWPTADSWRDSVGLSADFGGMQTVILDSSRPVVLSIPPGVAHGIMALDGCRSEILNAPTAAFVPSRPDELRIPADAFGFHWEPASR